MPPPRPNINPGTHPEGLLPRFSVIGVADRERAAPDEMRGEAGVFVRGVVGVSGSPGQIWDLGMEMEGREERSAN